MTSVYTVMNNQVESVSPVGCLNFSLGNGSGYTKSSGFINQKFRLQKPKVSVTETKVSVKGISHCGKLTLRNFNMAQF